MKTAFLLGSLNRGGTETLMLDICQTLTKEDFEAVALYRKGGALEEAFCESGVPFTKMAVGRNPLAYVIRLRKWLTVQNVDIVHAQQPLDAVYAKLASVGTKVKVVLTLHGFDYGASERMHRFILKRTASNIYVSEYQKNYYEHKYRLNPKKQVVVYNGVNFSKLDGAESEKTPDFLQKKIESPHATLNFAMVGNFVRGREQNTICKFLKLLKEQNVEFNFYFVGAKSDSDPHLYDDCTQFCTQNGLNDEVHFLGSRSDVPAILSHIDAFVYSTDHDTFGIAAVEAIGAAIPVFVNDWEIMKEITENGKLATLYKTKDENDLLEKFMLFLHDRDKRAEKSKEIVLSIRNKYSIEENIRNLTKVYNSL